jgi:hypothetical protein
VTGRLWRRVMRAVVSQMPARWLAPDAPLGTRRPLGRLHYSPYLNDGLGGFWCRAGWRTDRDFPLCGDGARVSVTGILADVAQRTTRQGRPWATAVLGTYVGAVAVDLYPSALGATDAELAAGRTPWRPRNGRWVRIGGRIDMRSGTTRIAGYTACPR